MTNMNNILMNMFVFVKRQNSEEQVPISKPGDMRLYLFITTYIETCCNLFGLILNHEFNKDLLTFKQTSVNTVHVNYDHTLLH